MYNSLFLKGFLENVTSLYPKQLVQVMLLRKLLNILHVRNTVCMCDNMKIRGLGMQFLNSYQQLLIRRICNKVYFKVCCVCYIFASLFFWGEWPSGLRRCDQNRKVPGSNPTRRSAGLRDPTSLRGSR